MKLKIKQKISKDIEKGKKNLIIVEGKKDQQALENLGFQNVLVLNETGKSFFEKIEQIENFCLENKKLKVCILTDFDKKGKKLYDLLKKELSVRKIKLDNSLRSALFQLRLSHIEGIEKVMKKK